MPHLPVLYSRRLVGVFYITLLLSQISSSDSFPSCTYSLNTTCYADSPVRAVTNLLNISSLMTIESCMYYSMINGFTVMGITGHPGMGYCYAGIGITPGSQTVPLTNCNNPCPGNTSEQCGGINVSNVYTLSCNGPLPPAPIGPPLAPGRPCTQPESSAFGFCNTSLPLEERVQDLVTRITLPEMGGILMARSSIPIPRLGLPGFYWGTNAIHGIAGYYCVNQTCPSSFADGVAMAASFNRTSWYLMGKITGIELRALNNHFFNPANNPNIGLTAWGPTINLQRDTRWGRSQESAFEDPYAAGEYGKYVSLGLQQNNSIFNRNSPHYSARKYDPLVERIHSIHGLNNSSSAYLLAVATIKHFAAYSLEDYDNHQWMRQTFNAQVSPFDLEDSYFPGFRTTVQDGEAAGIMYAANELNGVPCCVYPYLDEKLHEWGFYGYRATDGGQIVNAYVGHHYVPTLDQAIHYAVLAESDIADGTDYDNGLLHAVLNDNTTYTLAQTLLANVFRIRFRLGEFDPPEIQPYLQYNLSHVNDKQAQETMNIASREALVLLQNNNRTLPLQGAGVTDIDGIQRKKNNRIGPVYGHIAGTVAVIGPNCNTTVTLQGNYGGGFCPVGPHGPVTTCYPTIYTAITNPQYSPTAVYVEGSGIAVDLPGQIDAAVQAVQQADTVVMCLGLDQTQEAEQLDRYNMTLPQPQMDLYTAVAGAAAIKNIPVIVVLIHGGSLAIPFIKSNASAILTGFYPGVTGGTAIADTLFGTYNPGGKLPYTFYPPEYQYIYNFTQMDIANATALNSTTGGRTYRYYNGEPLWSFGYGLSYSQFAIAWDNSTVIPPAPPQTVNLSLSNPTVGVNYSIIVSNLGPYDGDEVLQYYYVPVKGSFGNLEPPFIPLKQLYDFQRIHVSSDTNVAVPLSVTPSDLLVTVLQSDGVTYTKQAIEGQFEIIVSRGYGATLTFLVQVGA